MKTNPYESPSASTEVVSAPVMTASSTSGYGTAVDIATFTALFLFAWIAVSVAYGHRLNQPIWALTTLLAVALPVATGLVRGKASVLTICFAFLVPILCPVVYVVADSFEQIRDTFFLGAGLSVLFVSSACTVASLKAHRRLQASIVGAVSVCSALAIAIMITIFMYLV